MKKTKKFVKLHPVMTFMVLCLVTIVISFILSLFSSQSTYNVFSEITRDYTPVTESVESLFSLSGLKYIFTSSVSNFANFTVLTNLIIILIGIGIMDKSGFLQTIVTLLTKKAKKTSVTFTLILICLLASIIGDIAYLVFIPLTSLFFYYGKRNPYIGIVASFGALTTGTGLSVIFTAIDSSLRNTTLLNSSVLDVNYTFGVYAFWIVSILLILLTAVILTRITENHIAKKLPKYDFPESILEEDIVTKKEYRGLILSLIFGLIYFIIIIYNIIPGLPFSGNFLDNTQYLYIDKLFSYESFFTNGFVFIIAMFFIILGLFYGIGSKSIKNNNDIIDCMGYDLDGIGKTLLLVFVASMLVNIFKQSNIGNVIVTYFANIIGDSNFTGLPLVILLFIISVISTFFVPSSIIKWPILASTAIPQFMNSGIAPEFAQFVFRLGESVSMGLTPLLAYFIVYIAYVEKYQQENGSIGIMQAIKLQLPYALAVFCLYLLIIILFYITNLPLGLGGGVAL